MSYINMPSGRSLGIDHRQATHDSDVKRVSSPSASGSSSRSEVNAATSPRSTLRALLACTEHVVPGRTGAAAQRTLTFSPFFVEEQSDGGFLERGEESPLREPRRQAHRPRAHQQPHLRTGVIIGLVPCRADRANTPISILPGQVHAQSGPRPLTTSPWRLLGGENRAYWA